MTKIKNIVALAIFTSLIFACDDNNLRINPFADVDHISLAVSDNEAQRVRVWLVALARTKLVKENEPEENP